MRIALAQLNPTIGDIQGNLQLIRQAMERAGDRQAELVVFPELAIVGYPPKDLLLKSDLIDAAEQAVRELAATFADLPAIVGYPARSAGTVGQRLHNAAALCVGGQIAYVHAKSLLPSYDVFDETRYFSPGPGVDIARFGQLKLGVSICEDLWNDQSVFDWPLYHDNPVSELARRGAELFVNCAASPFTVGKHAFRRELMSRIAQHYRIPLLYCNQVGGNDELIFDGNSCAFDAQGRCIAAAAAFEQDLLIVDLPLELGQPSVHSTAVAEQAEAPLQPASPPQTLQPAEPIQPDIPTPKQGSRSHFEPDESRPATLESAYKALTLGLADYCRKCGFGSVVLGLSGGIDSALVAALAAGAIGPQNVRGIAMPSRYTSQRSLDDAQTLAHNLGMQYDQVPIDRPHEALEELLLPHWRDRGPDETEENVQARIRGIILMAFSNKFGSLLVSTGNKSEVAVGYCTLYGDMAGGLAAISDVPKTMVYELARWINEAEASPLRQRYGVTIPPSTIERAPSAELRPDQTDQDSLPAYEMLDELVQRYVEREQDVRQIIEQTGFDARTVVRMARLIDRNEYKRKQMPPGLKITSRAFGSGRRMPIAHHYRAGGDAQR